MTTTEKALPLKAFCVTEEPEGQSAVIFAKHNVVARRQGAQELNTEFDSVSCRRAPNFDSFAPGPVPVEALLQAGWRFECGHCCKQVTAQDPHAIVDEHVYCGSECAQAATAEKNADDAHMTSFKEKVAGQAPFASIQNAWRNEYGTFALIKWDGDKNAMFEMRSDGPLNARVHKDHQARWDELCIKHSVGGTRTPAAA